VEHGSRGWTANLALASVSLTLSLAIAWLVLEGLDRDLAGLFRTPPETAQTAGIWRDDPVLGYAHVPGAAGEHEVRSPEGEITFSVEYHLDARGCRVGAEESDGRPSIFFVGGSYTFGHGVEDDEPFPAVLQRLYWRDSAIRNCAVMGWGTSNAYLWLRSALERETPAAVVYGFHPSHLERNYVSKEWLEIIHPRRVPHFELIDGRLEQKGTIGLEDSLPRTRAVYKMQRKLTRRFILEMEALCDAKGVPFWVLILPTGPWPRSDRPGAGPSPRSARLIRHLEELDVPYIDLRERAEGFFPGDFHPTPQWHRQVAAALAGAVSPPRP
jgi:hypothetical protein